MVNRERFIESVYHLYFYGNILNQLDYTLGDFTLNFSETQITKISFSIRWNILIITQSLRDELNKFFFNYNSDDINLKSRINAFKKIISPALEEIKNWSDIKEFRNNVLAHNGRDYEGLSVILSSKLENYNIPERHPEYIVLFQLLKVITEKAVEIFSVELKEAEEIMSNIATKHKALNYNTEEARKKVNNLITEMNKRAKEFNERQ